MVKPFLADNLAAGIDQAGLVRQALPSRRRRTIGYRRSSFHLSFAAGPPRRASFPVLAVSAQLPTGLASRPTRQGTGPPGARSTGETRGSRQAGPRAPV